MSSELTPLMQQYVTIKKDFHDTLLLFQVGDFYELFYDDAKTAASFLGITLTSRNKQDAQSVPLCGVPVHALDHYLAKLVKGGFHVAVCEQLEEPVPGKVVKRGVTRVLTPGTLTETQLLNEKSPSFILTYVQDGHQHVCVFFELLTGVAYITAFSMSDTRLLEAELKRFFPDEVVVLNDQILLAERLFKAYGYTIASHVLQDAQEVDHNFSHVFLHHLDESVKQRFDQQVAVLQALRLLYSYLVRNQSASSLALYQVHWYRPDGYLMIDAATQKNLELVCNNHDGSVRNTLFEVLDCAVTSMGSRVIRKWIVSPVKDIEIIQERQRIVEAYLNAYDEHYYVEKLFSAIGDLERVVGRIALDRAQIHDYLHLLRALKTIHDNCLKNKVCKINSIIEQVCADVNTIESLINTLDKALHEESTTEWIIKSGFNEQLDYTRNLVEHSTVALLEFEQQEQQRTGISSLKIRYNHVHGYYIEITKVHLDKVPQDYIRSQTLVGRERYTCVGLKKVEQEIVMARHEAERIEQELFSTIKQEVKVHVRVLRKIAYNLAIADALFGLARAAYNYRYVKPQFNTEGRVDIKEGRHPVIDKKNPQQFIPNDVVLNDSQQVLIVTGPNMGGKSTFLRTTGLISVMAQLGSFVPASYANIPLFDRIFTRIGAGDNVAEGKSTFFVEMSETALICNHATKQSLIIFDEIGRGTSTYDGLALAQAVVEYVVDNIGALCLFATHYHELTQLTHAYSMIKNFYAASKQSDQDIIFLYKILPGAASGSFGIDVARQAGVPGSIVERAFVLQQEFAAKRFVPAHRSMQDHTGCDKPHSDDEIKRWKNAYDKITQLDIDNMTPKQALNTLWQLKEY